MPAIAAHYLLGQNALINIRKKDKFININKDLFDIGLQGPDILFYYKPLKRNYVNSLGTNLHNQIAINKIEKIVEKIRNTNNIDLLSYLLGYVCHFAFDSNCHPIIDKITKSDVDHIKLETELDRIIIKNKSNYKNPEYAKREKMLGNSTGKERALREFYEELTENQIVEAINFMRLYTRLLYSPTGTKKILLGKLEQKICSKVKFANLAISKTIDIESQEKAMVIYEKYNNSVKLAEFLMKNIYDTVFNNEKIDSYFNRNFE